MKKVIMLAVALTFATMSFAQFEQGTKYAGLSVSGLNLTYSGSEKGRLDIGAQGGYFFMDNIAAVATLHWDTNVDKKPAMFSAGVQGRYYIKQNGIYLGFGCKFKHANNNYDDFLPGIEVGYAFYLNHYVTVEPAIFYDQSFKNHSDYSQVGLKIGAGFYF